MDSKAENVSLLLLLLLFFGGGGGQKRRGANVKEEGGRERGQGVRVECGCGGEGEGGRPGVVNIYYILVRRDDGGV